MRRGTRQQDATAPPEHLVATPLPVHAGVQASSKAPPAAETLLAGIEDNKASGATVVAWALHLPESACALAEPYYGMLVAYIAKADQGRCQTQLVGAVAQAATFAPYCAV